MNLEEKLSLRGFFLIYFLNEKSLKSRRSDLGLRQLSFGLCIAVYWAQLCD